MIAREYVEAYCSEDISKIENYEQAVNDDTQTWHCHHKLEIQGQFRNSPSLLKKCGLYYNVPAWQLIFLTKADHMRLHESGKHRSEETKNKMSMSHSGKYVSEETRKKISIANLGKRRSTEAKNKMSIAKSGDKNPMFGRKLRWWNNGTINKRSEKCPGEGWVRGQLITPKPSP